GAFSVDVLYHFMHNPSKTHFGVAKRVLWLGGRLKEYIKLVFYSWKCNSFMEFEKKASVALSSIEAEYVAATESASQVVCMLARNSLLHGQTKHIEINHHYIRELIVKEEIKLDTCRTDEQVADLLTKALPQAKHEELEAQLGLLTFERRKSVEV
ncbi:hypothetical protein Tco_0349689, partial [Tanacetum coccineum]